MYVKKPKKQCPHNEWVECEDEDCEACGWNPEGRTRPKERRQRKQPSKPQTTVKKTGAEGIRRADNTSGHPGVHFLTSKGKWGAEIYANKQRHWLGTFEKMEDAIQARKDAEKKFRETKRE